MRVLAVALLALLVLAGCLSTGPAASLDEAPAATASLPTAPDPGLAPAPAPTPAPAPAAAPAPRAASDAADDQPAPASPDDQPDPPADRTQDPEPTQPPSDTPGNATPPANDTPPQSTDNASAPGSAPGEPAATPPRPPGSAGAPTTAPFETGIFQVNITHNGLERSFKHYVPPGLARDAPAPMMVLLHGGTGTPTNVLWKTVMQPAADANHYRVLLPQGLPSPTADDQYRWQPWCCNRQEADVDDDGFILAAIQWMKDQVPIDATRVGIGGHSEGAMEAYVVAGESPQTFRFVASVSGAIGQRGLPSQPWHYVRVPEAPVNALIIHATDDPQIPYEGGRGELDPWTVKASVAEAIDLFKAPFAGIETTVVDDAELQVQTYRDTASDHRVVHIRTVGGHGWPAGIESTQFPYTVLVGTPPRPDTTAVISQWLTGDLP